MNQRNTSATDTADYAAVYFTGPATPAEAREGHGTARALGALQLALAAIFVVAGAATLIGTPDVTAQFGTISNVTGLGEWPRVATGILELVGAGLLAVRAAAGVGAVLLGAVMVGAVLAHVLVLRTPPTAPAVLAAALAVVAYAHRAALAVVAAALERNL